MEIREATEGDIPEIVTLLKLSLGESLMPKSKKYWQWKHLENPFGPSSVLLCWEGSHLVGVRSFMRWEWIQQGEVYRSVRAVDTATHPNHQGKGIFKKLTLQLLDNCMQQGDHFVFNTPNQHSRPRNLSMGWEEIGKLPIQISLERPFAILKNFMIGANKPDVENSDIKYYLHHPKLELLVNEDRQQVKTIVTNKSVPYLIWRYLDVPVAQYVAVGEEQGDELTGLIIGRIKQTQFGRELRITDFFLKEKSSGEELILKFRQLKKAWGIDYATLSGTVSTLARKVFPGFGFKVAIGPVVTVRALCLEDLSGLEKFNQWSPSLGDLELF